MLDWFAKHSDVLTVFTNLGTLLIWLVYAQLLYFGFRRQRRPRLIINRSKRKDINALCIISNMSAEAVFLEYIIAELKTSRGTIIMDVTDYEQARNEDSEAQPAESKAQGAPAKVGDSTNQGPLASGGYLHIGSFDALIKRMAHEAGIEMEGHRPKGELQFQALKIRLIGIYGSEDAPIGAERSFNLIDNEHECALVPLTWDTKRLASAIQRRRLRKRVADFSAENFSSSSTIRFDDDDDDDD